MQEGGVCRCHHHKIIPLLIALFGLTFLLGNLDVLSAQTVNIIWPSLIILAGLSKIAGRMCGCCSHRMGGTQ
ncbi:MAG: DUF5668 domain-containing protein [Patescibacteria group bacterium]